MKREDILARSLARKPHPMYGLLTGAKFNLLQVLGNSIITGDIKPGDKEQAWAICILDHDDPAIVGAVDDRGEALEKFWREALLAPDLVEFMEWFNSSWDEVEASAAEEVPEKGAGKSEERELAPTG